MASRVGILAFFEPSTRTKVSFEAAGRQVGIEWIDLKPQDLSLQKGESLRDTFLNLKLYEPDFFVVRHSQMGLPHLVQEWTGLPVFNAGDGQNEHPTQALGDAFTLWKVAKGKRLNVVFFGDVYRSRVARSTLRLLKTLGHRVAVTDDGSSETRLFAKAFKVPAIKRSQLPRAEAIIGLRWQKERGSSRDATPLQLSDFGPKTLLMHPGPVIVNEDISFDVLENLGKRNLILSQAEYAFQVRRLLLADLVGRGART